VFILGPKGLRKIWSIDRNVDPPSNAII